MKKQTCIELPELVYPVKVEQSNSGFTVTYGKQVKSGLSYNEAARAFGYCVFHALACDDKINNNSGYLPVNGEY
jgi:hypothetical protein